MKKKGNGIVLADIVVNIVVLVLCIYKTYFMFQGNTQDIGMQPLFGLGWVFGAVLVAGFLIFDFLCLRSRKKDEVNAYNEAYVTMSLLLKAMVGGMAILYFILV